MGGGFRLLGLVILYRISRGVWLRITIMYRLCHIKPWNSSLYVNICQPLTSMNHYIYIYHIILYYIMLYYIILYGCSFFGFATWNDWYPSEIPHKKRRLRKRRRLGALLLRSRLPGLRPDGFFSSVFYSFSLRKCWKNMDWREASKTYGGFMHQT